MTAPIELRFVVEGPPVPLARPRFDPRTRRTYTDPRSRAYQSLVRGEARAASLREVVDGRLVRREPAWPSRDDCEREGFRRAGSKPPKCDCAWCSRRYDVEVVAYMPTLRSVDGDNLLKQALDSCTGALWRDDRQVTRGAVTKAHNPARPRLEVVVRVLAGEQQLALGGTP